MATHKLRANLPQEVTAVKVTDAISFKAGEVAAIADGRLIKMDAHLFGTIYGLSREDTRPYSAPVTVRAEVAERPTLHRAKGRQVMPASVGTRLTKSSPGPVSLKYLIAIGEEPYKGAIHYGKKFGIKNNIAAASTQTLYPLMAKQLVERTLARVPDNAGHERKQWVYSLTKNGERVVTQHRGAALHAERGGGHQIAAH